MTVSLRIGRSPVDFDDGYAIDARFGLIVLSSDPAGERECRLIIEQAGVDLIATRIANSPSITRESLLAMEAGIAATAATLPTDLPYAAVAFLCTSASRLIGFDKVEAQVRTALGPVPVTNPMLASLRALEATGARRVALLTPYREDITREVVDALATAGLQVVAASTFDVDDDRVAGRLSAKALDTAIGRLLADADVDAVFISCTTLRTVEVIDALEQRHGVPVISSNQAVAWDLLRLAGRTPAAGDWGRLFRRSG